MAALAPTANIAEAAPFDAAVDEIILQADEVSKVFPGTLALNKVDFNVYRGQVNALVGENGAGKSTLMKILAGVERPTSGRLMMDGEEIHLHSTRDAEKLGIGIIYQELNLCPNLSVVENIFLGREIAPSGVVDRNEQRRQTSALIQRLGHKIDPDMLVSELRIGQQQVVEIAKSLAQDVRVLIMDEPTSALSVAEVAGLFKVIRDLKAAGVSIIYISHKLEEITQICDTVTVLRDGQLVAQERTANIGVPWIIEMMVGKNPAALFHREKATLGDELLRVEEITLPRLGGGYAVDHVSITVRQGEVVGIYGLMGAGRSELFECLAGRHPEATGRVFLGGKPVTSRSVSDRIDAGIVLVPEDRQRDGLVQTMSVEHNMLIASLQNYLNAFLPFLVRQKEKAASTRLIKELGVRVANPSQIITSLSGGNQQKVVVAKGLLTAPRVLLLDEPSRGIDVNAKSEIFSIMARLADQGYGVLFISSELKEVLAMSDRILVMSRGAITGEFLREDATEEALVNASGIGHGVNNKSASMTEPSLLQSQETTQP
jgi:erythritol transport system ATP-binding protein